MPYRVPHWSTYQGYKKRGPSWVKLHVSLLRKMEWLKLPISGKALLPAIWIIASENGVDGTIPDDHELLAHLSGIQEPSLSEGLNSLISFRFIERDEVVASLAPKLSGEERRERGEGEASETKLKPPVYIEPPMPIVTPTPAWETRAKATWSKHMGGENDYIFADLVPVVRRFGEDKTLAAWESYCEAMAKNQDGKFASARAFAQKPGPWIPKDREKVEYMTAERLLASQK